MRQRKPSEKRRLGADTEEWLKKQLLYSDDDSRRIFFAKRLKKEIKVIKNIMA